MYRKLCLENRSLKLFIIDIAHTILLLAEERGKDKSICPSEVARQMFGDDDWRSHMEDVRNAAFHLQDEGKIAILQKGEKRERHNSTGPIRIQII